nr:bifunctional proline dehydrogenase/L-glutamate gamma-semialdehyde dehydrogenase PutA [Conchiformibius kuhniae]
MFQFFPQQTNPLRRAVTAAFRRDEAQCVADAFGRLDIPPAQRDAADETARELAAKARCRDTHGARALLETWSPLHAEGRALMCLTEALPRIADAPSRHALLQDALAQGDWDKILRHTEDPPVSWLHRLTGKAGAADHDAALRDPHRRMQKAEQTVRMLAAHFVAGSSIEEAAKKYKKREKSGYCFSFALPCTTALSEAEAQAHYQSYTDALHTVGALTRRTGVYTGHGLSVRLSSLCPFYRHICLPQVQDYLLPKLKSLLLLAKEYQIPVCFEGEDSATLELGVSLVAELAGETVLAGYHGIGLTVQAYQKRAPAVIELLADTARKHRTRLMVRLVKGGHWEQEIRNAQNAGLNGYPVYTRKTHTDLAYLACAQMLLEADDALYPQFATHNPDTVAAIYHMGKEREFEFQCQFGAGESLFDHIAGEKKWGLRCRVYLPVGETAAWSPYIVRRMRDRFTLKLTDTLPETEETADGIRSPRNPLDAAVSTQGKTHPALPLPRYLYGANRLNAIGIDFSDDLVLNRLQELMNIASDDGFQAMPLTVMQTPRHEARFVQNPANANDAIGAVSYIQEGAVHNVVSAAKIVEPHWAAMPVAQRADALCRFADTLESCLPELLNLIIRESGKTARAALDELRLAADYCRYYAREAENVCAERKPLGTVVCISPWHAPLSAFVGQIAAALAAGNTVLAKPAAQTTLTAYRAVSILHGCGIPPAALQLLTGGADIGAALVQDPRINGVLFSGTTATAKLINHTLGQREDLPAFIAESDGQSVMIADSSTDIDALCRDALAAAFDSAGQRRGALRLLCVQDDIADQVITRLCAAADNLIIGNPADAAVTVGPVIDQEARDTLSAYIDQARSDAVFVHQSPLPPHLARHGGYIAPTVIVLDGLAHFQREVFGTVLHVCRFRADRLGQLIDQINEKGYALQCSIRSRISSRIDYICHNIEAGHLHINRTESDTAPGVRPFGGYGLSGTGTQSGCGLLPAKTFARHMAHTRPAPRSLCRHPSPQHRRKTHTRNRLSPPDPRPALRLGRRKQNPQPAPRPSPLGRQRGRRKHPHMAQPQTHLD